MDKKKIAKTVFARLAKRYDKPKPALNWQTPWQLLVATVLSAQCTDERVNKVTPEFFRRWPDAQSLTTADVAEIEEVVRSTGFFRNKAKNLKAASIRVMEVYCGKLPENLKELTTLGGVARKTANIVLSNAFGIHEGIAIDTHVKRISNRLGLTQSQNPAVIEKDLMPLFPQDGWGNINHFLVFYGREVCKARKPLCQGCELEDICPKIGVENTGVEKNG